jgi:xanthine/uracil permease
MVEAEKIDERISRGVSITGLSNFLSGILSVVGTVNYAMSPGIIASTRSASRFALLPVAFMLILFSFFPILIHCFAMIPKTVIASVFIYVLCYQCIFALKSLKIEGFGSFLTILISILVCFSITFAPKWVFENIPDVLEPVVGNGFIAGLLVAIIFEQVLRKKDKFISETRGHGKEGSG